MFHSLLSETYLTILPDGGPDRPDLIDPLPIQCSSVIVRIRWRCSKLQVLLCACAEIPPSRMAAAYDAATTYMSWCDMRINSGARRRRRVDSGLPVPTYCYLGRAIPGNSFQPKPGAEWSVLLPCALPAANGRRCRRLNRIADQFLPAHFTPNCRFYLTLRFGYVVRYCHTRCSALPTAITGRGIVPAMAESDTCGRPDAYPTPQPRHAEFCRRLLATR